MNWRIPFALVFAPVLPCALVALSLIESPIHWPRVWGNFLLFLTFACPAALLIAGPSYLLLSRFWRIGKWACIGSGAIIGIAVGPMGFAIGALSGGIFWFLAIRGTELR